MTDKELKKLKRGELLEILLFIQKEYDELKAENELLKEKLRQLEEKLDENSDSLSENDLERVSEILNSSLSTGTVRADEITGTLEALIERWKQSEREEKILSEEKIANKLELLISKQDCVQADPNVGILQREDYRRLAGVMDYVVKCSDKRRAQEGALHESDLSLIAQIMTKTLSRHERNNKSEGYLTDRDISLIEETVKKAVLEAVENA